MQKTSLPAVAVLGLSAALALAGCKKPASTGEANVPVSSEPAAPESAAPAGLTVTSLTVGNVAAADKSVASVATLGAKDPVIVSVKTDGSANGVVVSAKLTYQDGQTAGEQAATLSATSGSETTNITFHNPSPWPAGKYTAEVTVDGKSAGNQGFEIK